jgi:hypothetical protein
MRSFPKENDFSTSILCTPRCSFLMAPPISGFRPGLLSVICALLLLLAVPDAPAQQRAAGPAVAAQREPDPRPGIRQRVLPEASSSVQAETMMPLLLSEELSAPPAPSDLGRQLLRLEQRTIEILRDPNTDQQALSEKLAWLEANVAELRRAEVRLEGLAVAIPAPAAARPAAAAAALPEATPGTAPPPAATPAAARCARTRDPVCRSRRFGGGAGLAVPSSRCARSSSGQPECFVDTGARRVRFVESAKGRSRTDRTAT